LDAFNIDAHARHWRDGAQDDWAVAHTLLQDEWPRHAMFFAHLALEKALKALVCLATNDFAPRTHNLVRLAEAARLDLTLEQRDLLAEMNQFSIEGRYPDIAAPVASDQAAAYLERAEEVYQWLIRLS
jgi:HEPN domain-containing protein